MTLCGLLVTAALGPSGQAGAQNALADTSPVLALRGDETPETVRKLVDMLSAGGRKVEIRILQPAAAPLAATPAVTPQPQAASDADTQTEALWDHFIDGLSQGVAAVPRLAAVPAAWRAAWAQNHNGLSGPSAGWRVLAILTLALTAAGLFRIASAGWFSRRLEPGGSEFSARLIASGYGLLQDLLTLGAALAIARGLRMAWLPESDLAVTTLQTIANGAAIGSFHLILGRFLLAPGAPQRRIMPLPRPERHFRIIVFYGVLLSVLLICLVLAQRGTGSALAAGLFMLTGSILTLIKVWWFIDVRNDLRALILSPSAEPGPGRRLLAANAGWFYAICSIAIWMVGNAAATMADGLRWAEAAGLTQFLIVLAPILAVGVTNLLACRQTHAAAMGETPPLSLAVGYALRAAAGGAIWAGGFYLLARLWASFLLGVSSDEFASFMRQAGGVAVLAFGGWVAIVFLRSFFDAYTPQPAATGPADEDAAAEDHVPSRLATVLPVLRGVVLAAVIGLTALVLLSRLGVDIGPLLAGFGILGLAISFGSQALVRDIVSGFFFMLEDAFRVGEYVDTGRLKGTVEKISLRSMQLRHQSGQVHTVPFGQVQSLTNASRDWATVKFNVRLDHSADIEKARKTIKKIGLALLEDPEYGPHFIAQLKMQGVADITDAAIVIRLKFTSKPNQASMLQREALKRVYRGLNEAEVPFASNAVTVREGGGKGAAAAIATVLSPTPLVPAAE